MVYRVIGLMSGSSLDGLDIVFAEIEESGGKWSYQIIHADCLPYAAGWKQRLQEATSLSARDYLLLHSAYGHYLGEQVNAFIEKHQLQYKVALVASHGHTTFHLPGQLMTAQLGDGSAIAAITRLPVVTDLRALDVALGGQGAPIVPVGEQLLFPGYEYYLNIGGIANVSINDNPYIAFDICPANRVLNLLAEEAGKEYDENGLIAASGQLHEELLNILNQQEYYQLPAPKSLANEFGTRIIYPLIQAQNISTADAMRTYAEHIAIQTALAAEKNSGKPGKMLITGGGALNKFLMERISEKLQACHIETVVPDELTVSYKEALIMGLIGVLRWREENNVLSSVTGARRDSAGGAMWMGQEN